MEQELSEDVRLDLLDRPTPAESRELTSLYRAQGWWEEGDDPELLARIIRGSHFFVVARNNGRVIGMGRAISDRASDAYIQDLAVEKEFRGAGIGRALVKELVRRLNGAGIFWIALIAEKGSSPFYEGLGFSPMPDSAPMKK